MNQKHGIYVNCKNSADAMKMFPLKVLKKNFNINLVGSPDSAEVIIDFIERKENILLRRKDKKFLIIAGDNLKFKKNLFSLIESFFGKTPFKEKKYKIMDFLDKIIPKNIAKIPIISFFNNYDKLLLDKFRENKIYLITTNKIKRKNSISIPLFIQNYSNRLNKLRDKRIPTIKDLSKKKFCAFIVSSNSSRERVDFFKKLSKYKRIDSYGKVMNNMGDIIQDQDWKYNPKIFENYKFVICFENSFAEDYITEKLLNVMFANSIPIYRGAPNTKDYFNTKSFINFDDYGSYEKIVNKIIELDKDDKKYLKFLDQEWFIDNKIPKKIDDKEKALIQFYEQLFN